MRGMDGRRTITVLLDDDIASETIAGWKGRIGFAKLDACGSLMSTWVRARVRNDLVEVEKGSACTFTGVSRMGGGFEYRNQLNCV